MSKDDDYGAILLQVYGAALAPAQWRDAWLAVSAYTGAEEFHFFELEKRRGALNFGLVSQGFWHQANIEYDRY